MLGAGPKSASLKAVMQRCELNMVMAGQQESGRTDPAQNPVRRKFRRRGWYLAALQMAALVAITILLEIFDADRRLAAHFYRAGKGWYMSKTPACVWLYAYGTVPGILLSLVALIVCLAGLYSPRLKVWRKPCLLVVLTTVIAAGLLVNAVLKQYWGRPRPSQTVEFGGHWNYRPIFPPGPPGKGASFPCGHCAMGFVFLGMVGFWRQNRTLAISGIALGTVLGVILSAARMVQGAHFLSDAIWSLGIVTMTVSVLYAYLAPFSATETDVSPSPAPRSHNIFSIVAILVAALVITAGFLTRRPYHATKVYPLDLESSINKVDVRINADTERVAVRYSDQPMEGKLQVDAHGFGWMNFDYHIGFDASKADHILHVRLEVKARSYFAELDHTLTLTLPQRKDRPLAVTINGRPLDGVHP